MVQRFGCGSGKKLRAEVKLKSGELGNWRYKIEKSPEYSVPYL
jgi:hypothetical protein